MQKKRLERWARKNHKRRTTGKLPSKTEVVERWGNRCHLCEKKIDLGLSGKNPLGFTFDHVIPVSLGGTNDAENIRPAHWICNIRRGNRGPVQLDLGMCG
jgi:5-methylcytosine-specific restriction endonuclease McrA